MKFTIHTKHTSQPDGVFPVAHTCSLSLERHHTPSPSTYSPYLLRASPCPLTLSLTAVPIQLLHQQPSTNSPHRTPPTTPP
jgi:hypothetical protein